MTVTDTRPTQSTATPKSQNLAKLRAMLDDEAERENWPEIREAIHYLTMDTIIRDLAA